MSIYICITCTTCNDFMYIYIYIYIYPMFLNVRVIIIFYLISHRFYFLVSSPTFLRYFLHVIIVALVIHNILLLLLLLL